MKFSIPFLAKQMAQLPLPGVYKNQAVEAVIFNRQDLESSLWHQVWQNIQAAARLYGSENVTFHFPVNESDYAGDFFVADRLEEGLRRACDLGLHGIVVHSNRIKELPIWESVNLDNERKIVIDKLNHIREKVSGCSTWLALENMPVMDNYGKEIDPLFVYPSDFALLKGTKVKVVWDVCHYTNTLANIQEVIKGHQHPKYYPNLQNTDDLDFLSIRSQIAHWHFSAFEGVCNPDQGTTTKEGVIPSKSTLGEKFYAQILSEILKQSLPEEHIVFEIQEECYMKRKEVIKMIKWVQTL